MGKIYQVFHRFTTDGGFGDAVRKEEVVCTFRKLEDAEAFVKRFSNPHIYDEPYAALHCGELIVMESDVIESGELNLDEIDPKEFWWNRE